MLERACSSARPVLVRSNNRLGLLCALRCTDTTHVRSINLFSEQSMAVKPIPDGFNTVTPYLLVNGVAGLMQFLEKAFDAETLSKMPGDDGSIMHAEMRV